MPVPTLFSFGVVLPTLLPNTLLPSFTFQLCPIFVLLKNTFLNVQSHPLSVMVMCFVPFCYNQVFTRILRMSSAHLKHKRCRRDYCWMDQHLVNEWVVFIGPERSSLSDSVQVKNKQGLDVRHWAHAFNPIVQEAEQTGVWLWGQPGF